MSSPASSPVAPGKFWHDVTHKACWENSPGTPGNKRQIQNGGAGVRFRQNSSRSENGVWQRVEHFHYCCLFRALSVLVCSEETKSVEFRIRCVIELALNSTYYLADEQLIWLISRIQAQEQLLGTEGSDSVDVGLIPEIFRAEVLKSYNMYVDLCAARKIGVVLIVIQSKKSATKF